MSDYVMEYWVEPMATIEMVLENYVELSPYQILFEADNPDVSEQMKKNTQLEQQGDSAIMKIIKGITGLISRIIQTITDFFAKLFMNGDEKRAFDEMQKKINEDPNVKNKKLTIKDFRKLNAEFNDITNKARQEAQAIHEGRLKSPSVELMNRMQSFIDGAIKPGSAVMFTTVALNAARSDAAMAKTIASMLSDESKTMKALEASLGKKEAGKFRKQIDMYTAEISIKRKLVNMGGKHYNSLQECMQDTVYEVQNLLNGKLTFTNVKLLLTLGKNKDFRQNVLKPRLKEAVNKKKKDAHRAVYNAIPGQDNRTSDTLGFMTGGKVTTQKVSDKVNGAINKVTGKFFGDKDNNNQNQNDNQN